MWATESGHPWPKKVLDFYQNKKDFDLTTNTIFVSELLKSEYHIDAQRDEFQELADGIAIYPSSYFCLDLPKNYATHHFVGTWHERDTPNPFKNFVHSFFYLKKISEIKDGKKEIFNVVNNMKMMDADEILNQFPLRMLIKHIIKRLKHK